MSPQRYYIENINNRWQVVDRLATGQTDYRKSIASFREIKHAELFVQALTHEEKAIVG